MGCRQACRFKVKVKVIKSIAYGLLTPHDQLHVPTPAYAPKGNDYIHHFQYQLLRTSYIYYKKLCSLVLTCMDPCVARSNDGRVFFYVNVEKQNMFWQQLVQHLERYVSVSGDCFCCGTPNTVQDRPAQLWCRISEVASQRCRSSCRYGLDSSMAWNPAWLERSSQWICGPSWHQVMVTTMCPATLVHHLVCHSLELPGGHAASLAGPLQTVFIHHSRFRGIDCHHCSC